MSARERLHAMIRTSGDDTIVWPEDEATTALDAYRAEVLAQGARLLRRQAAREDGRRTLKAGLTQGAIILERAANRTDVTGAGETA